MFGTSKRRSEGAIPGYPAYDQRYFMTNDARCNAFDDYNAAPTSVLGSAGAAVMQFMRAFDPPRGFGQAVVISGYGGNASPIANGVAMPLVSRPEFAGVFAAEITGMDRGLY